MIAYIYITTLLSESWILCEYKTKPDNAWRVTKIVADAMKEYRRIPGMKDPPKATLYYFLVNFKI